MCPIENHTCNGKKKCNEEYFIIIDFGGLHKPCFGAAEAALYPVHSKQLCIESGAERYRKLYRYKRKYARSMGGV